MRVSSAAMSIYGIWKHTHTHTHTHMAGNHYLIDRYLFKRLNTAWHLHLMRVSGDAAASFDVSISNPRHFLKLELC